MARTREELDELMTRHEKGDVKQVDYGEELKIMAIFVGRSFVFGMIIYTALGLIASYLNLGDFSGLRYYGEWFSGYGIFFVGILFAISFYAARGVFMGEMTRRAWTNTKNKRSDHSAIEDIRSFINFRSFIGYAFLGTLFAFVFYFIIYDKIF